VAPDDEAPRAATPGWPPPHSSPPLPPPREYGTPGTPLAWRPWLWGVLAVLAVAALVTAGLAVLLPGDNDDGGHAGRQTVTSTSASASASTGVPSTAPAPPAPFQCWDGSGAQELKDCSVPKGAAGLAWVFPPMAHQKCGKSSHSDPGVVQRVLCVDRLIDGNRVRIGYYEWESIDDGLQFYKDQNLAAGDLGGFHRFSGASGDLLKSAALYEHAPFSFTITVPPTAVLGPDDVAALASRPPGQLLGGPVG
jgi:hypothetical protein